MAKETIEQLSAQLTALLSDIDTAIAARLQGPRRRVAGRRRPEATGERKLPGMVEAALRWLRPRKHA